MASHPEWDSVSTALEVARAFPSSINGRVFLITGVSQGGIGGATAKALAAESPRLLILTGRSLDRVNPVINEIEQRHPNVTCRFLQIDLASQGSVRKAAAEVLAYPDVDSIDTLINNAGVMDIQERTLSPEGIEMQFATNHIGHFLFTNLILPKLLSAAAKTAPEPRTANTRVVNLSSRGHLFGGVRFSDHTFAMPIESIPKEEQPNLEWMRARGFPLNESDPYIPLAAYGQSKTANILFSLSLRDRLAKKHNITSFAVHPGSILTELQRNSDQKLLAEIRKAGKFKSKSLDEGASTTLVAALDPALNAPELADGKRCYLSDCQFEPPAAWAQDLRLAERLWHLSEELVGQSFSM